MPKDTFFNLNNDKKKRIFDAAIQEFSTRSYSDASLNQIVKAAKIPWGSFYQYFHDKEDIYLYLLDEIAKDHQKFVHKKPVDPDAGFFETFMQQTIESLELAKVRPEYTRIGMLMQVDNSDFIVKLRSSTLEALKEKISQDKARGIIKPEIDSALIVDMIFTFTLEEYFRNGQNEDLFLKKLNDAVNIVRYGVLCK